MAALSGEFRRRRPEWALPLTPGPRYLGAHGGRGSGKSHEFAEMAVERLVIAPDTRGVCIREIQRSTRFSVKSLIESKIEKLGVSSFFDVLTTEIRRRNGKGILIFEGMQDHTADSIKSLEGFDFAWIEEAQSLSQRSLNMLRPTIRKPGSQIWATWNPDKPEDAIDALLRGDPPDNAAVVEVNYGLNPYGLGALRDDLERDRRGDPETFAHVWLGKYNTRSAAQVFAGRYAIDEFKPGPGWDGPYYGADWGFSQDPTVLVKLWLHGDAVYWEKESGGVGIELDAIAPRWMKDAPEAERAAIRADGARPETISHVKRKGFPGLVAAPKWAGSVEDGVEWLRGKRHVIHPQCPGVAEEFRLYSYKQNKAGDVLTDLVDAYNHRIDAARYALAPMIQSKPSASSRQFRGIL